MAESVRTTGDNRASTIRSALNTARIDNSILHLYGHTSDIFMNEGRLQGLPNVLAQEAAKFDMATVVYSLGEWARQLQAPDGPMIASLPQFDAQDPPTIHLERLFERIGRERQPCLLVLDYCEALIPDQSGSVYTEAQYRFVEQVLQKTTAAGWQGSNHRIVLISRVGTVDQHFRRMPGILNCSVLLPGENERYEAIQRMRASEAAPLVCAPELDPVRLSRITGGLNLDELSRWRYRSSNNFPLTADMIYDHKGDSVREKAGQSLSVADERRDINDDIAGLENVKQYVRDRLSLGFTSVNLLLAGGPGTGKTSVATAIGQELGAVVIFLDQPKSKWVGETEDNMKRVLEIVESMAPAVLVIDEADQTVFSSRRQSASEEHSSVESSTRAILMQWMGDTARDIGVSVVATTNNPAGIDAAVLDRMVVLAVLEQGSPQGRAQVLAINARKNKVALDHEGVIEAFRKNGKRFTGRHIVSLLDGARLSADHRLSVRVEEEDVTYAIEDSMYNFGVPEMLASMRAVYYTRSKRSLPWVAAWAAGDSEALPPPYIQPFVDKTGGVDTEGLAQEIARLEATGVI